MDSLNNREIYLDNSATTPVLPEIAERVREVMVTQYGNPSSLHRKGVEAELLVTEARRQISRCLVAKEQEIVFTSGGTEANNLALLGVVGAHNRKGKRVIVSAIEHPSIIETATRLNKMGYDVVSCPVDNRGLINPQQLAALVTPETILVSVMMVNNEIGALQPIRELVQAVRNINKDAIFHSDCVQALGKIPLNPAKIGLDLVTISSHKVHGPKGAGALYVRDKLLLEGQVSGGGQERQLRPGTENVPGIVGFGMAVERACSGIDQSAKKINDLRDHLINCLRDEGVEYHLNGDLDKSLPNIVSLRFNGVRGEVLVHFLESRNVFVSTGSACHSRTVKVSHVLKSIGASGPQAEGTIRVSFSALNVAEDVEILVAGLKDALSRLKLGAR